MNSTEADVVIAGGGPTGLMLASELALNGVRSMVLDALPGPNPELRANSVGGMAVRLLDNRGLYEQLAGSSDRPRPSGAGVFAAMAMNLTDTPHSQTHLLVLPQPRLAAALAERAGQNGAELRWGHRVHGFAQGHDDVRVDVDGPAGRYRLTTKFLVGADGGRSTVRKLCGIEFPGMSSNDAVMRIGYGLTFPAEWVDSSGAVRIPGYGCATPFIRSRTGLLLWSRREELTFVATLELAPTPDDTRRAHDHPGYGEPLTKTELEDSLLRALGVPIDLEPAGDVTLRQYAGINSRVAERYRQDRVLLAGDAAHVHSPVGGPGLNLSLQDAANLGWKLAAVVHGRVDAALLDTYEAERRLAGERVVMHSRAQFALLRSGPEIDALRQIFGEMLDHPAVREHIANTIAGTTVRYPIAAGDHPAVGYWMPDITIDTAAGGVQRIAQLVRDGRPLLLDFTDRGAAAESMTANPAFNVVAGTPLEALDLTAVLVRPDGYVAWASSVPEPVIDDLHTVLARWFGAPPVVD